MKLVPNLLAMFSFSHVMYSRNDSTRFLPLIAYHHCHLAVEYPSSHGKLDKKKSSTNYNPRLVEERTVPIRLPTRVGISQPARTPFRRTVSTRIMYVRDLCWKPRSSESGVNGRWVIYKMDSRAHEKAGYPLGSRGCE